MHAASGNVNRRSFGAQFLFCFDRYWHCLYLPDSSAVSASSVFTALVGHPWSQLPGFSPKWHKKSLVESPSQKWVSAVFVGLYVRSNSHQQELLSAASGTPYVPLYHDVLQGVTQPRSKPEVAPATFGFVERAERWNSRACMVTATLTLMLLYALAINFILW